MQIEAPAVGVAARHADRLGLVAVAAYLNRSVIRVLRAIYVRAE